MVVPFLNVKDVLSLDSAMSDKKLRQDLLISYRSAALPTFDMHTYTDRKDFKGLRWVMKAGVCMQSCRLVL